MKTFRTPVVLLLSVMLLLTCLTACGQKATDQSPSQNEGPTVSQDNNVPSESTSNITDEPEISEPVETPEQVVTAANLTYGGVPIMKVLNFIATMEVYGHDACVKAFGEDKADTIPAERNATYYKYKTLPAEDVLNWLDENFLRPVEPEYDKLSQADLEILRNKVLVIRSAAGGYAPSEFTALETFLTDTGMEIYHQWHDQISEEPTIDNLNPSGTGNNTQNNETSSDNTTNNVIKTADFSITNTEPDLSNQDDNGDVRVTITVTCPDMAGSDTKPNFIFLHKDANGKTLNVSNGISRIDNADTGSYRFFISFNERSYKEDGSYTVNPVEGHLYAFRVPADFQIASWWDLTVDQCVLIF